MFDLDFYVDIALFGRVFDIKPGDTRDRIEQILGDDFVDETRNSRSRRDYGLIEFSFGRAGREWICSGFSVQVHRLTTPGKGNIIPKIIADQFGYFRETVKLDDLVARAQLKGDLGNLVREKVVVDFGYFSFEGSSAKMIVSKDVDNHSTVAPGFSDIWSIEVL